MGNLSSFSNVDKNEIYNMGKKKKLYEKNLGFRCEWTFLGWRF